MFGVKKKVSLLFFHLFLLTGFCLPVLAASHDSLQLRQPNPKNLQLTAEEQTWLNAHPVIRVANKDDWPPYDFSKNGKAQGLAIDLARRLGFNRYLLFNKDESQVSRFSSQGEEELAWPAGGLVAVVAAELDREEQGIQSCGRL